jgi:hypothetical protein
MKHYLHTAARKLFLLVFIIPFLFTWSCETIDTLTGGAATVSKLEGSWAVEEQSEIYKSTAQNYEVTISADADDESGVIIDNFYGVSASVKATVSAMSISIPNQDAEGGFSVSGSGTISSNFEKINLTYNVDDGSGVIDHVTAVYTKN